MFNVTIVLHRIAVPKLFSAVHTLGTTDLRNKIVNKKLKTTINNILSNNKRRNSENNAQQWIRYLVNYF